MMVSDVWEEGKPMLWIPRPVVIPQGKLLDLIRECKSVWILSV